MSPAPATPLARRSVEDRGAALSRAIRKAVRALDNKDYKTARKHLKYALRHNKVARVTPAGEEHR